MKELYFGQGRIVLVGITNNINFKDIKNKIKIFIQSKLSSWSLGGSLGGTLKFFNTCF